MHAGKVSTLKTHNKNEVSWECTSTSVSQIQREVFYSEKVSNPLYYIINQIYVKSPKIFRNTIKMVMPIKVVRPYLEYPSGHPGDFTVASFPSASSSKHLLSDEENINKRPCTSIYWRFSQNFYRFKKWLSFIWAGTIRRRLQFVSPMLKCGRALDINNLQIEEQYLYHLLLLWWE